MPTLLYPEITDVAAWSDEITHYDQEHFITYARILDAERAGADWREAVRIILLRDPETEPEQAWLCWETHLARAKWITTTGVAQAIARASAH
jgi:hypothetical protein